MDEQNMQYKLMVLYMLSKVDFSLTYTHISDFILGRGYTDYFSLQQAIAELTEAGLVHQETLRSTTYYMITPEGEETIGFFKSRISLPIREDIDHWLKENHLAMLNDVSVRADYYRDTEGNYEVRCTIREKKTDIFDLHLKVTDEPVAKAMCKQWKAKNQSIYEYVMKELMQ